MRGRKHTGAHHWVKGSGEVGGLRVTSAPGQGVPGAGTQRGCTMYAPGVTCGHCHWDVTKKLEILRTLNFKNDEL